MQPEMIADYRCETGEGPLWHPMEKSATYLDWICNKLQERIVKLFHTGLYVS